MNTFLKPKNISFLNQFRYLAQQKFESFKRDFEIKLPVLIPETYIVIQLDGVNFSTFTTINKFHKPVDMRSIDLMNYCAMDLFKEKYSHTKFAYGFSDEYSFALELKSNIFNRNFWYIN